MLMRINSEGKSKWREYVLGRKNDRVDAKLIAGNPKVGDEIIENLDYKSGNFVRILISFSEEETQNFSPEETQEITQELLKEYMVGFDEDEYHLDIVEHTDTKKRHYHCRIPKVNLLTNTQLKLYFHRSDLNYKKAVLSKISEKYHLEDTGLFPRIKTIVPPRENTKLEQIEKWRAEHKQKPLTLKTKKDRMHTKTELLSFFQDCIVEGQIQNQEQMCLELEEQGFSITKIGFDDVKQFYYITVEKENVKMRLQGEIFNRDFFDSPHPVQVEAIKTNASKRPETPIDRAFEIDEQLKKEREKRLKWIEKQYGSSRKRAREKMKKEFEEIEISLSQTQKKDNIDDTIGRKAFEQFEQNRRRAIAGKRNLDEIFEKVESGAGAFEISTIQDFGDVERRAYANKQSKRRLGDYFGEFVREFGAKFEKFKPRIVEENERFVKKVFEYLQQKKMKNPQKVEKNAFVPKGFQNSIKKSKSFKRKFQP